MSTPTRHNASQVLLGVVETSDRVITCEDADPASFPAGRAVRRSDSGSIGLALATGGLAGVSLGPDLSDAKKTAVCRAGNRVPIQLAAYLVQGDLTFISKVTTPVSIEFLDTASAGSEVVTVVDGVISVAMEDGVSTATQMKAALDGEAEALALIETQIASGEGATAQAAFAEDAVDTYDQAVPGASVLVSDVTGMAIPSGGSATGALYVEGAKDGISYVDGSVAYKVSSIDMGGGL